MITEDLTKDQNLCLRVFNELVSKGHGELLVVIRDGKIVKIQKIEKIDLQKRLLD